MTILEETQQRILGSALESKDQARLVMGRLSSKDFTTNENKSVFRAIETCLQKDAYGTAEIAKAMEVDRAKENFPCNITAFLMHLSSLRESAAGLQGSIQFLKKESAKRNLLEFLAESQKKLLRGEIEWKDVATEVEESARNIKKSGSSFMFEKEGECCQRSYSEELQEKLLGVKTGIAIGKTEITMSAGSINVVAGATGHGKTTFLINTALKVLDHPDNSKKSVIFCSYEEPKGSIITNFINAFQGQRLSQNNGRSIESFYRDSGSTEMFPRECSVDTFKASQKVFFEELCESKRLRIVGGALSAEGLCAEIENLAEVDKGLCCVFLDYFQLISMRESSSFRSRQEELKKICLMLGETAKRAGLPIVMGSQFNRKVVDESTLTYTNISEAGDIERIASLIIGFWNRNFLGFGGDGNKTKWGDVIKEPKSELYVEVLKGRHIGAGMNSIFPFDGNARKVDFQEKENVEDAFYYNTKEENQNSENLNPWRGDNGKNHDK